MSRHLFPEWMTEEDIIEFESEYARIRAEEDEAEFDAACAMMDETMEVA